MKNFNGRSSHGHHGSKLRELVQHAHSTWIARIHSHTYINHHSYLQPRCAKRQLCYYGVCELNATFLIYESITKETVGLPQSVERRTRQF